MRPIASARRSAAVVFLCCAVLAGAVAAPAASTAPASATADPVFSRPVSAETRAAMADSFGRLSEKAVVSGTFVQTKRIQRLGRDLVSKGEFLFSSKDGVYWKLTSPYPSTIVMTATKLVQVSESGETSVIDSKDNAVFKRIAGTMQAVFSGSLEALEADFKVHFQGNPSSWRLGLVPKEKSVRDIVASIVVEGDESIRRLTLAEGSGDFIVYAFATTRRADELEESERGLFVY
jgi:hypothetical protein